MKSKAYPLFLSIASALLLSLSWYWNLSILVFFALVPLLFLEEKLSAANNRRLSARVLFGYVYLCFFIWNVLVTWWVVYASFGGACLAFFANSLLMTVVFTIYVSVKNTIKKDWAVWLLIPVWIAWEHVHTLWDLTWTWLTLGNVFAFTPNWVQWYEYTGTSGGTLWILASNLLVFQTIKNNTTLRFFSKPVLKIASIIVLPILLSFTILITSTFKKEDKNNITFPTVVVQPNIDPYHTKFSLSYQQQFIKTLDLVRGKINAETAFLVLPETFVTDDLDEAFIGYSEPVNWFRDSLLHTFPQLQIITGGNTYVFYEREEDVTATARSEIHTGKKYDMFNSAIYLYKQKVEVYHKSKLVPGVERMPFPALLAPLESLAINMGGTMGSLGIQKNRSVFTDSTLASAVAPVVCYESVYADYVSEYVRKGANLIFIITNDGWWEDTPGYIQHLNYARLRAIENRRQIARCANTGISCFIDEFGAVSEATGWWEEAVIEKNLKPNNDLTFFSRFGDLIAYISVFISIGLIVLWCKSKIALIKKT